jgi:hypothetical protein
LKVSDRSHLTVREALDLIIFTQFVEDQIYPNPIELLLALPNLANKKHFYGTESPAEKFPLDFPLIQSFLFRELTADRAIRKFRIMDVDIIILRIL